MIAIVAVLVGRTHGAYALGLLLSLFDVGSASLPNSFSVSFKSHRAALPADPWWGGGAAPSQ
jgi:hypothetical protein